MVDLGRKGKVTLYMDVETVETAKELGLNISKTCENALKDAIQRLETPIAHISVWREVQEP